MNQPNTQLTRAMLIFTPGQYEQFYRPFEGHLDGTNLNNILIATNEGKLLTPAAMASVASSIISPASTPIAQMAIPNGMREDRFAFFLEITTESIYAVEREIIKGFTDGCGVNPHTGSIDPNMRFHINSRTVIRESPVTNAYGTMPARDVRNDYSILAEIPGMLGATALRPEDAVAFQQVQQFRYGESDIRDTRTSLMGVAKQSNTQHCIPSHYLSDICNGYRKASNAQMVTEGNQYTEYEDGSSLGLHDNTLPFIRAESIQTSNFYNQMGNPNNPASSHTFTFGELNYVWPRKPDFWIKVMPQPGRRVASPLEYTEHWAGATVETSIAFSLTHILPALMTKLMLVELELTLTNMTMGNGVYIQPLNWVEMFEGVVTEDTLQFLCTQVEMDIVRGLLQPKAALFDVYMKVNLLSNSQFQISINGGDKIPYNAPMFCDSYYSPLIGMDDRNLKEISDNIENLAGEFSRYTANPWGNPVGIAKPSGQPMQYGGQPGHGGQIMLPVSSGAPQSKIYF